VIDEELGVECIMFKITVGEYTELGTRSKATIPIRISCLLFNKVCYNISLPCLT